MKNLLIEKGYVFITLTYLSKPLSHLQVLTHAQAGKASFIFNMNFFENQKKKKLIKGQHTAFHCRENTKNYKWL